MGCVTPVWPEYYVVGCVDHLETGRKSSCLDQKCKKRFHNGRKFCFLLDPVM